MTSVASSSPRPAKAPRAMTRRRLTRSSMPPASGWPRWRRRTGSKTVGHHGSSSTKWRACREEVSRPATRDIQSRQESKKSGRWMIGIGLALTALSIAGPIIASNIASENSGDNSNTSPSPSSSIPGPPEDYKELLSRLPASERSTCRDASSLVSSQLAEAHCSSGWYSLWKTNADGRDWVLASDMKRGDCLHNSLGRKSAYQYWSKNGLSGLLTCFHASDDVCLVEWSIKSLRITGTFRGDDGCYDYKELISKAVRVRDAVK